MIKQMKGDPTGILVYPEVCIPQGWTVDEVIEMWKKNGTVVYQPHNDKKPYFIDADKLKIEEEGYVEKEDETSV